MEPSTRYLANSDIELDNNSAVYSHDGPTNINLNHRSSIRNQDLQSSTELQLIPESNIAVLSASNETEEKD